MLCKYVNEFLLSNQLRYLTVVFTTTSGYDWITLSFTEAKF